MDPLKLEPSTEDLFWEAKMKTYIEKCDKDELKEVATLLIRIATQRQGVIRGLIKDNMNLHSKIIESFHLLPSGECSES
ncbi:MAG: hypothetical protein Tp158DCM1229571_84 [Prokaryotic dsDNA virus sp.]|nr:MAG: hypothetical protein Tp158DCM1229571_84 [Prokaryotic dsDNA virus sp.]|tara:strand:- start:18938 stop:19174 length:237 start_codon:yes stop_codon:yes gene_type:complete